MDTDPNPDNEAGHGAENPLSVGEPAPANASEETTSDVVSKSIKDEISRQLAEKDAEDSQKPKEKPLSVRLVKDGTLTFFEEKTVRFGKYGAVIAALSLIAAGVAAYFVYQQFAEMNLQSSILSASALRARIDSNESSKATSKQMEALQTQIDNTQVFFRTDERSWIVISAVKLKDIVPAHENFAKQFIFTVVPKNVGKTVARDVRIHIINPVNDMAFLTDRKAILKAEDVFSHEWIYPNYPGPQTLAPNAEPPVPLEQFVIEPQGTKYGFILGRIDYVDVFHVSHWLHFCYFAKDDKGTLGHCLYGNDQDSNPETQDKGAKPN